MNRNVESHFSDLPQADIQRSIFDRSSGHKTSFNFGQLIPFFWDEVLPGDTFNISTSIVARLQTLLTPVMDNAYIDTYYFFIPNRLVWNHWKEFMGENSASAWIPETEYSVPVMISHDSGWDTGTIADYLGIPVNVPFNNAGDLRPSALPFRAYALVCNEWFRDENLSDPLQIPVDDTNYIGSNGDNYITDVHRGGKPFKVAKYHDYFTSCLPSPQKGPAVMFGNTATVDIDITGQGTYPVKTFSNRLVSVARPSMRFALNDGTTPAISAIPFISGQNMDESTTATGYLTSNASAYAGKYDGVGYYPVNLGVELDDISATATAEGLTFSINELRLAFQLQKFYEKNARGGSRYREILKSHFGVSSPDARMMIPEYLGGHRFPLSIHQVENQSQGETDFLGDLGAMSVTSDVNSDFIKSFTEHGIVMGVMCARYDHSYPQGLGREWTRRDKLDYYWPVFANIGEQPVYKYEIDASARMVDDARDYATRKQVFGYQEAWASYRYKPNRVSGEMRPGISNSLANWHFADYYETTPSLSDSWIREDKANVDRTLAVTSAVSNQIFADIYIKNIATRPMPMYSIPGLIDHH